MNISRTNVSLKMLYWLMMDGRKLEEKARAVISLLLSKIPREPPGQIRRTNRHQQCIYLQKIYWGGKFGIRKILLRFDIKLLKIWLKNESIRRLLNEFSYLISSKMTNAVKNYTKSTALTIIRTNSKTVNILKQKKYINNFSISLFLRLKQKKVYK